MPSDRPSCSRPRTAQRGRTTRPLGISAKDGFPVRRVSHVIALATALALGGVAVLSASAAREQGCRLSVRYTGSTAGTGDVFAYFRVHNVAKRTCAVGRYPSVRL